MKNALAQIDKQKISLIKSQGTTFDRIKGNLMYGEEVIPLSAKDKVILQRWDAGWTLLNNYHSNEQAIPLLMAKFEISRAQAYRDLQNSKILYGNVFETTKAADRYILSELAMKTFQLAAKQSPPDIKSMNMAVANLIKIKALDKEDPETFREEDLQQHNYFMVVQLGKTAVQLDLNGLEKVPQKTLQDICSQMEHEITDVEAIELIEGKNGKKVDNI
jgi:hypothetical protein